MKTTLTYKSTFPMRSIFRRRNTRIVWHAAQPHPEWQQAKIG